MSDVTGPISTLPGACHGVAPGTMCDDHPEVPAVARIQGETDSFGSEMHDLCAACVAQHHRAVADARCGACDWCQRAATDLRPRRDYDEGMYGRVYDVCGACVKAENERASEELESMDYYDDWGDE